VKKEKNKIYNNTQKVHDEVHKNHIIKSTSDSQNSEISRSRRIILIFVSTGVVGKQGGVEMSAHCHTGLHEKATKNTDFAAIKVQLAPSNLRGDRRPC